MSDLIGQEIADSLNRGEEPAKPSAAAFSQSEIESMDDGEVLDRMLTCGFRLSVWRTEIRRRLDVGRKHESARPETERQAALEEYVAWAEQLFQIVDDEKPRDHFCFLDDDKAKRFREARERFRTLEGK